MNLSKKIFRLSAVLVGVFALHAFPFQAGDSNLALALTAPLPSPMPSPSPVPSPSPTPTPPPDIVKAVITRLPSTCPLRTVVLSGASSSSSAGAITSYRWTFGDGATASGPSVSHTYAATGTYLVTLTVTDSLGVSASATLSVTFTTPNFQIADPLVAQVPPFFRQAYYAIFRTDSPTMRIDTGDSAFSPQPGTFHVIVDDGQDDTPDTLDIGSLFSFSNGIGTATFPAWVDPSYVPLDPNNPLDMSERLKYRTNPTTGLMRIFYVGENHLRISLCPTAPTIEGHVLLYTDLVHTLIGYANGFEPANDPYGGHWVANHILLILPNSTDQQISDSTLLLQHLVPQGYTPDAGLVQVRPDPSLAGQALFDRIAQLGAIAHADPINKVDAVAGEKFPPALVNGFDEALGTWKPAANSGYDTKWVHYQHFTLRTFPAHRLIEKIKDPAAKIRADVIDTGFANKDIQPLVDDADASRSNAYFIRSNRLVKPTLVQGDRVNGKIDVAADGATDNVQDIIGHGTTVISAMAADGVGNKTTPTDRLPKDIVLGTAPDIDVRPIKNDRGAGLMPYVRSLETVADDDGFRVLSISDQPDPGDVPDNIHKVIDARYKKILFNKNRLVFGASSNEGTATADATDVGRISPDRTSSRSNPTNAQQNGDPDFKNYVRKAMLVGAANRVIAYGKMETRAFYSCYGKRLSVLTPGTSIYLSAFLKPPPTLQVWPKSGTSYSAPMAAGMAAELMLVNPALQEETQIHKVLEYLEASADDVDVLGVDDNAGFGRVNYWRAALSVANNGLSKEGRTAAGGHDAHFDDLDLIDEAHTKWYGFEVRLSTPEYYLAWEKADPSDATKSVYENVEDADQKRPPLATGGFTDAQIVGYSRTQNYSAKIGGKIRVIPPLQFKSAEIGYLGYFIATFSIQRDDLLNNKYRHLVAFTKGAGGKPAQIFSIPINPAGTAASLTATMTQMRSPATATDANIKSWAQVFTDFAIYIGPIGAFNSAGQAVQGIGSSVSAAVSRVTGLTADITGRAADGAAPDRVLWSVATGPGEVHFNDASAYETTAGFSTPGSYVLKFTVWQDGIATSATVLVAVQASDSDSVAAGFARFKNDFDPARGEKAAVAFGVTAPSSVSLRIYTTQGLLVRDLVNESKNRGNYTTPWDGRNDNGSTVASDIYIARLRIGDTTYMKKIAVLK